MLQIAVCDDEEVICDYIEFLISGYALKNGFIFNIKKYTSGIDLVSSNECFDIVFLDVGMPEMNGIEVGKNLREKSRALKIIYVSAYSEYAIESYEVKASFYLIKPINKEKFFDILEEVIKSFDLAGSKIMVNLRKFAIHVNEVIYIKGSKNHRIILHTKSGEVNIRGELKDFVEEFEGCGFVNPRRGIWVNHAYIEEKDEENVYLAEGKIIKMSKNRGF